LDGISSTALRPFSTIRTKGMRSVVVCSMGHAMADLTPSTLRSDRLTRPWRG
jgi:hypothetical protein